MYVLWISTFWFVSRLARGVWVEIAYICFQKLTSQSRLARGVWVEIMPFEHSAYMLVSRLARGVWVEICPSLLYSSRSLVTPRKRRVSRNFINSKKFKISPVTPRKRRVSRNIWPNPWNVRIKRSRLARGVWVEMQKKKSCWPKCRSRLARGVWVEITCCSAANKRLLVTPRERRVSRNYF